MEHIIDGTKTDSIYDQLEIKLKEQKLLEQLDIKTNYDEEDIYQELEYLERDYELYNSKLELFRNIDNLDVDKKKRSMEIIFNIDDMEEFSPKKRLKMILSYGVLINYFGRIHERTNEEIYMLSACSSGLDLEDYTYYIGILSNEQVASVIINKSDDFGVQVDIAYDIMDAQDEFPYDFITRDNYNILVNNGVEVINNYSKEKTK